MNPPPPPSPPLQIDDDPANYTSLDLSSLPLCVSLVQIGSFFVADASPEEEQCAGVKLAVAVKRSGHVCSVHRTGIGGVDPLDLIATIQVRRVK